MILIKNQEQIEGIRRSSKLAAECLRFVEPHVKSGVTTNELNTIINDFITSNNATSATLDYKGYPKECCISLNEVICHGIPDTTVLRDGDILNIDVTTNLNGYFGDTSRMFKVGDVSKRASKLIDIANEALWEGIEQVRPGRPLNMIGYKITKLVEKAGFSVVYQFVGHGVGVNFHEEPQIVHYISHEDRLSGPILQEGMIFTIEPMINEGQPHAIVDEIDKWTARTVDGSLSAQWEHTILVTKDGYEVLTL